MVNTESRNTVTDSQVVLFGELWGVNQLESRSGAEWLCLVNDRAKLRVPIVKTPEQGASVDEPKVVPVDGATAASVKIGLCINFRECPDSHPWDAAKFVAKTR